MFCNSPAGSSERTNGVCFVNVQVTFVLLSDCHHFLELANFTFHRVDTFHHNQNLCPGLVWLAFWGLPSHNGFLENLFKRLGIVVLERHSLGPCVSAPGNKRGMIKRIADNKTAGTHQRRDGCRVGAETHVVHDSVFLANKPRHKLFELVMNVHVAKILLSTLTRHAPFRKSLANRGAASVIPIISKAEVVVRSKVERRDRFVGDFQGKSLFVYFTIHYLNVGSRARANGSVPAVVDSMLEATHIKRIASGLE
mmetsp:Transcript_11649/g.21644  ORF Transcript_11649/g.21644 Transcript_11649/m.21644 type:complete len:253 (+) Transcript_11649:241-999(+)